MSNILPGLNIVPLFSNIKFEITLLLLFARQLVSFVYGIIQPYARAQLQTESAKEKLILVLKTMIYTIVQSLDNTLLCIQLNDYLKVMGVPALFIKLTNLLPNSGRISFGLLGVLEIRLSESDRSLVENSYADGKLEEALETLRREFFKDRIDWVAFEHIEIQVTWNVIFASIDVLIEDPKKKTTVSQKQRFLYLPSEYGYKPSTMWVVALVFCPFLGKYIEDYCILAGIKFRAEYSQESELLPILRASLQWYFSQPTKGDKTLVRQDNPSGSGQSRPQQTRQTPNPNKPVITESQSQKVDKVQPSSQVNLNKPSMSDYMQELFEINFSIELEKFLSKKRKELILLNEKERILV